MIRSLFSYRISKQHDSGEELYELDAYPGVSGFGVDRSKGVHIDSIPGKPTRRLLDRVDRLVNLPEEERDGCLNNILRELEVLRGIKRRNRVARGCSRDELLEYGVFLWPITSTEWREVKGVPSLPTIQKKFGKWRNFAKAVEERIQEVGEDYIPDFERLEGRVREDLDTPSSVKYLRKYISDREEERSPGRTKPDNELERVESGIEEISRRVLKIWEIYDNAVHSNRVSKDGSGEITGKEHALDFKDLEGRAEEDVPDFHSLSPLIRDNGQFRGASKQAKSQLSDWRYRRNTLDYYFGDLQLVGDVLPDDEQAELARRMRQGDEDARDRLIECNLRFVISVAKEYQSRGVELTDLIQAGNIGLLVAAERFDESRGYKFISYAVSWVRQQIMETIKNRGRNVRFPLNIQSRYNDVDSVVRELEEDGKSSFLHLDYIAELTGYTVDEVRKTLLSRKTEASLDDHIRPNDERRLYDVLSDESQDSPDKLAVENSTKEALERALSDLTPREIKVLRLYYGFGEGYWRLNPEPKRTKEGQGLTLDEIGEMLGVTRERVRQIKEEALGKLRHSSRVSSLMGLLD